VPDLATFGKSMGNGFPISAVVGKARYMAEMEEIFFSSTFGGETLSLAATLATIRKMQREPVHEKLNALGTRVIDMTRANVERSGLTPQVSISGKPSWSLMQFKDAPRASAAQIKSLYLQEVIVRGVLTAGSHNICYAHTEGDLQQLERAQRDALALVREAIDRGDIAERLMGPPIEPVFRVR
jgi:glutamate-1-semialdehyde 2,1-aminomutase